MFKWKDRKYVNARKKIFKNMDTNEILNLEVQDDEDNILEESDTPLTAHCLNMAQQELVDDMSKTYAGTNITAPTVKGTGRNNKVYGFCRQETREGRNFLPILPAQSKTSNGVTLTSNGDGSYSVSGTATANASIFLDFDNSITLPSETLYCHLRNNVVANCALLLEKSSVFSSSFSTINRIASSEKLSNLNVTSVGIYVVSGATINATFKPSVEVKSEITEYEAYGASPSPDYPAKVHCLGDDINLFDGELELGSIHDDNGSLVSVSTCVRTAKFQEVRHNTQYVLSNDMNYINNTIYLYDSSKNFIGKAPALVNNNYASFTTTSDTCYLKFRSSIVSTQNNLNVKYKLQEGTVATPWSPFGYGTTTNKSENKNIFDLQKWFKGASPLNCTKQLLENGLRLDFTAGADAFIGTTIINVGTKYEGNHYQLIGVKPNTKYTFSISSMPKCYINELDEELINLRFIQLTSNYNKASYTFTTKPNTKYLILRLGISDSNYTSYSFTDIQIEEGDKSDYVPHEEDEQVTPLKEPLLGIGYVRDELDLSKGETTRRFKKVTLVGHTDENWRLSAELTNCIRFSKPLTANHTRAQMFSHFKYVNDYDLDEEHAYIYNNILYVFISKTIASTLEEFKTWLSQNPVEVVLRLATPIIEDIDCSDKIKQYDGQTTVYNTDGAELECTLTNNRAIAQINQNLQQIEEMISSLKAGE